MGAAFPADFVSKHGLAPSTPVLCSGSGCLWNTSSASKVDVVYTSRSSDWLRARRVKFAHDVHVVHSSSTPTRLDASGYLRSFIN